MRFFCVLFFFIFPLCLLSQHVRENQIKKVYYISSSLGSNSNVGTTKDSPLRSIAAIKEKEFVKIRLNCGDVFFEHIEGITNSIIESYGSGDKPIVCGFKILKDANAWVYDAANNIWTIDLSKEEHFKGYLQSNNKPNIMFNNVGIIYDPNSDKIYGNNVKDKTYIHCEGDFYTNSFFQMDSVKQSPFNILSLKIDKDPRTIKNLCFSMGAHGISNSNGCIIRNISFVGFSRHGVANAKDALIEHCQFDLIGGAIQVGYKYWVRYGNGIEIGGSSENVCVQKCIISRTYDCGCTIQGTVMKGFQPKNIHFRNNILYKCRQAFEHFINPSGFDENPQYINCEFTGNTCFFMGENEFGTPQQRDANILSYENADRNVIIKSNTFYGASHYCGYTKPLGMNNNKVYIYKGQYLNHYHGQKNYPTIYADGEESISKYKEWSGDNSKIVIIEKGSAKDVKMKKRIEKKVGFQKPELHLGKSC